MAQLSVTATLADFVTQEQYDVLVARTNELLVQYGHMFSQVTMNNVPPSLIQIPVIIKISGISIVDAQVLVASHMNTSFGNPPTAPVIEIDVGQAS